MALDKKYNRNERLQQLSDRSNGITIPSGIYRGVVIDSNDTKFMGRVKVHVAQFFGSLPIGGTVETDGNMNPTEFVGAVWCRVLLPYGGITPIVDGAQTSYGISSPPPLPGSEVVVAFGNDGPTGLILGIIAPESRNSTVTGPNARLIGGVNKPSIEIPRNSNPEDGDPPEHKIQSMGLKTQGLDKDKLRGPSHSSARREESSRVFGMSTPSGHSFVMDDGETDGNGNVTLSNLVRIRTAAGAQILMDDMNGFTYIISKDGKSWIEMNANGDLDVHSDTSISMHTDGDFNVHAGGNINMQSDKDFNMKAVGSGGIKMETAAGPFNLKAALDINLTTGANGNVLVAGAWTETAALIHMNGPPAAEASPPSPVSHSSNTNVTSSISARVPEHEPWKGHAAYEEDDGQSHYSIPNTEK
jgi:hypothetical protein